MQSEHHTTVFRPNKTFKSSLKIAGTGIVVFLPRIKRHRWSCFSCCPAFSCLLCLRFGCGSLFVQSSSLPLTHVSTPTVITEEPCCTALRWGRICADSRKMDAEDSSLQLTQTTRRQICFVCVPLSSVLYMLDDFLSSFKAITRHA